jgi:hypothetical protein
VVGGGHQGGVPWKPEELPVVVLFVCVGPRTLSKDLTPPSGVWSGITGCPFGGKEVGGLRAVGHRPLPDKGTGTSIGPDLEYPEPDCPARGKEVGEGLLALEGHRP